MNQSHPQRSPQSGTIPKPLHSLGSHTPFPRPPREGDVNHRSASTASKQRSGEGSINSQERRSALERFSLPKERVSLLQDGAPNAESGRLQEVPIQQLEEVLPLPHSGGRQVKNLIQPKIDLPSGPSVRIGYMSCSDGDRCSQMTKMISKT
ncbi:hypothetical protein Bca4012_098349 [Brassica carinata]